MDQHFGKHQVLLVMNIFPFSICITLTKPNKNVFTNEYFRNLKLGRMQI